MIDDLPPNESVEIEDSWGIMYRPRNDINADELLVRSPMWFANVHISHEEISAMNDTSFDIRAATEERARHHIVEHILTDPTVQPYVEDREKRAYRNGLHAQKGKADFATYKTTSEETIPNGWFKHEELLVMYKMLSNYVPRQYWPKTYESVMKRFEHILSVDKQYYEI